MLIEEEVFRKTLIDKTKLEPFGFTKTEEGYFYSENFMDGHFSARITVDDKGNLKGTVWDNDSDEEYYPVHVKNISGAYVSRIREEYEVILRRIRDNCCQNQYFLFAQSNRITEEIRNRYGETPDFPFKKLEDYGVFRCPENRKWYGLIMNIPFNRMFGGDNEDLIEILNVKIIPQDRDRLLRTPGIYDCYHMNRNSWVSIVMDNTVSDEDIMKLVDVSRSLVLSAGKPADVNPDIWIVPANPDYYDIDKAFKKTKGVDWKQGHGIKTGDIVYMYVGAPVSAVRYKCVVTETGIPYEFSSRNVSMKRLMKMDVLKVYPADYCTFRKLNEFGVRAVRGPRRVSNTLDEYLNRI